MDKVETPHIITQPTRFELSQFLFRHHYCAKTLSKKMNISEPAVLQYMRVLKEYDIFQSVKIGYEVYRELINVLLNDLLQLFSDYPPKMNYKRFELHMRIYFGMC